VRNGGEGKAAGARHGSTLLLSSETFLDPGPHRRFGEEQQLLFWQATPAGHVIPQSPQLVASDWMFTHMPLHCF
jgi:hypothetical protein